MTFYIKPPRGSISLNRMTEYTKTRYDFLLKISKCHGNFMTMKDIVEDLSVVTSCDCLIEASQKDQVSHFLLRLACCQNYAMTAFFIESEISLFSYRISCMTRKELLEMIKPLTKLYHFICATLKAEDTKSENTEREQLTDTGVNSWPTYKDGVRYSISQKSSANDVLVEKCTNNTLSKEMNEIKDIMDALTDTHTWEELVDFYVKGVDDKVVCVSFHHVTDLVAKRLVKIHKGSAFVPCKKLGEIFRRICELILRHGLKVAQRGFSVVMEDERIRKVYTNVKRQFEQTFRGSSSPSALNSQVLCEDVDMLQEFFPPCMSHLHSALRDSHRLRHHSRVQYTLFLKELGLPVNEAIQFWSQQYSKPNN